MSASEVLYKLGPVNEEKGKIMATELDFGLPCYYIIIYRVSQSVVIVFFVSLFGRKLGNQRCETEYTILQAGISLSLLQSASSCFLTPSSSNSLI